MVPTEHFSFMPQGRTEYFRNAMAVVPLQNDPDPGLAIMVMDENKKNHVINCNCGFYRKKGNCKHTREIAKAFKHAAESHEKEWHAAILPDGPLYRLASVLHDACALDPGKLVIETDQSQHVKKQQLRVHRTNGDLLLTCFVGSGEVADSGIDEANLLAQRTGLAPTDGNPFHRGRILNMLSLMTMTGAERILQDKGMKSRRQAFEESFWYRLVYHFRTIYGLKDKSITAEIEESTGRFLVKSQGMEIVVPRQQMMRVKRALTRDFQNEEAFEIWPESMESIVKVTADSKNNLKVVLYLLLHLPDGSTEAIERKRLSKFWYDDMVYIPEKQIFASWRKPDRFRQMFGNTYSKKIKQNRLPEVIEKIGDIFSPPNIVDESVQRLKIYRECNRIEIDTHALDRDWCWLSFQYGFGENISVSLYEIFNAGKSGKRYISVADGWVDIANVEIEPMINALGNKIISQISGDDQKLRLSRTDLLRFQAAADVPLYVTPSENSDNLTIRSILEMRLTDPLKGFESLTSPLRSYQQTGVDWLGFLYENRLGGLLCDEMGLGKTHQIMALMVWLSQVKKEKLPFIVVCPTTVITHWSRKIHEHASTLFPIVYHGIDRELEKFENSGTVLITSYGILLKDIDRMANINFSVAVFDEAQYIKNPETKSYLAADLLKADLKIVVTGTPIENRLGDLKALMDLVLPGYLGSDNAFKLKYELGEKRNRIRLRKMISPFTLRRTKAVVLNELPDKIEDILYCRLTDTQIKLYRQAVAGRGKKLLHTLQREDQDIPYIHIFALLTLLKQICNHPASVIDRETGSADQVLDSGKWELFVELLDSCLENGLKIVVFSQFVKMIDIIVNYLENRDIKTAGITGKTRNRGREIDSFNNDPECRVFVGSLKAGGSGIDLTGGSVVIHYDRWWNAAKEDQATDRVHRIGQTRGVQVFKLVTEGTLEEKISAIIANKKKMMNDVIAEDDPGILKSFSREELIDLIRMPD